MELKLLASRPGCFTATKIPAAVETDFKKQQLGTMGTF
jgi:hypothetical protein